MDVVIISRCTEHAEGPGQEILKCPSVCPSVMFFVCFRANFKIHCCIFSKLYGYMQHVMAVCCIVFDIDGILFEFFLKY